MDSINFFELVGDASIFEHAFDKAIAKTKLFSSEYNQMRRQVEADSVAVDAASKRVSGPSGHGGSGTSRGSGVGFGTLAGTGALALGYGALAGGAAALGIGALLQSQVQQYAAYSAEILRNSQALNVNAQDLQTWDKIASKAGLDSQSMTMDFARFEKNLAEGAPQLKLAGVDLQQLGITSTNTGTAVLQLADYFHTHSNEAEKAAIATALFGRSGTELIPILDQGSSAFRSYQEELRKTGVLLSDSELVAGARAQVAISQFGEVFDGAKNRLLSTVLPGFTLFFGQLTSLIQHNEGMFVGLGQTVDNVLLFITGILAGLTGTDIKDLGGAATDAGAAYEGLGQGAQDASQGIDTSTNSTKAAKNALAELQAETQLQIDALDREMQALDDVTAAYNDQVDAQKQSLQDQLDQQTYVTDSRRRQGEDLVSYERRLEQLNTQQKIKALDDAKATFDRSQAAKKRALEDERANLQRVLNQEVNNSKAAADAMALANQNSFAQSGAAANSFANQALPAALTKAQQQTLLKAQQIGKDITDIFSDKNGVRDKAAADLGASLGGALVSGFESGFASAMKSGIFGSAYDSKTGSIDWVKFLEGGGGLLLTPVAGGGPIVGAAGGAITSNPYARAIIGAILHDLGLPGFDSGGIVTQRGVYQLAESNTEVVLNPARPQRSLALMRAVGLDELVLRTTDIRKAGGTAAPTAMQINFNGPVADELVASRVATRMQREARRKGLLITAGRG